jgi:hypothetical protein
MPLLTIIAFDGDGFALALVVAADCRHQRVNATVVGAEQAQAHFPACEASEQPPEGLLVAVATL